MELKDAILGPLYLLLILVVAYTIRNSICKDKNIRPYFIPALVLKLFGAITLGLIYQFYYKGGDTFSYFTYGSKHIWNAFQDNPMAGLWMIFGDVCGSNSEYHSYASSVLFACDSSSYFIVRLSGFFGLFTFHTYTANALLFALISFAGVWNMFVTFYKIYPQLKRKLILACFFLPSVIFWGSGLMKDSITFGCLGLLFSSYYAIFIAKRWGKTELIVFVISFWVIKTIKIYIILCFIPAAILLLFMHYNQQIRSRVTKMLLKPVMIGIACLFGYMAAHLVSRDDTKYSMNQITQTAKNTSQWLTYVSKVEKGSGYDLGPVEYTPLGLLKKIPAGINVTLFRPYLWECKNVVMFFSALESTFFIYLTLITLFRTGVKRTIGVISENPIVAASLVFSFMFSFAIGISTANFGTLVRYKIPIMPFYLVSILVIRSKIKRKVPLKKISDWSQQVVE